MSVSINELKIPIEKELKAFEFMFKQSMKTRLPLLNTILSYIVKQKGKQIRPLFVMYAAKLFGDINIRTYRGASLVELLHTASLVHDDVVDDSFQRRGFWSINALWKNKVSVLVGDYLLSQGLLLAVEHRDFDMLEILSKAVKDMSEGELQQLERARFMNVTEDVYFHIIKQKTAALFACCCEIGAASTTLDTEVQKNMRNFGELVGLAFQIRDDLFDFGDNKAGKPSGIDIKGRKLTLPIIHAFSKASSRDVQKIKKLIRSEDNTAQKMKDIVSFITAHGGMSYSRGKMDEFRDRAFEILESIPAEKQHKQSLQKLVNFVIDRTQ
ncbi:MAG: polyprenyl synthetase family protein [Bacteroidetes bacterium]|nr:polyprenyl synthetase family protein [Bacteroidota bacterium]